MGKFDWIPEQYRPAESEHVEYKCVYRATKSTEVLTSGDFLPYCIENPGKAKLFHRGAFGVSLFTDLDSLKAAVKSSKPLDKKTKSFSKGFTTIIRGISTKEEDNHHVDYYLDDYLNNNPYSDFEIIEVKK